MRPEASALQFFSIDHNSGALATVGSVPGPAPTLGLTAVNNQFYVSDSAQAQLDGFSINQTTGALTALMRPHRHNPLVIRPLTPAYLPCPLRFKMSARGESGQSGQTGGSKFPRFRRRAEDR
jgi:hypothetical protein